MLPLSRGFATIVLPLAAALAFFPGCSRLPGSVAAHTAVRRVTETLPATGITAIHVKNLVGSVTVESTDQATIEIIGSFAGGGSSEADARAQSERLALSVRPEAGVLNVRAVFPVDELRDYQDPRAPSPGTFSIGFGSRDGGVNVSYGGQEISVGEGGSASLLYADMLVRVPRGIDVRVENAVGEIHAMGLEGSIMLDAVAGEIHVRGSRGPLAITLEKGLVRVIDGTGRAEVRAASAACEIVRFAGDVRFKGGDGPVDVREANGQLVEVETVGGSITLREVSASLEMRTRGGSIEGAFLRSGERFVASTGTGRIQVSGDFAAARGVTLRSESGGVELGVSDPPPIALVATTERGILDVQHPQLTLTSESQGRIEGSYGAEAGRIEVHSDSGTVRVYEPAGLYPANRTRM